MVSRAYLGTDLPEESLRQPVAMPAGESPPIGPMSRPPAPMTPMPEDLSGADPGYEGVMDTIMERAERYMGMTPEAISALDNAGWMQLMQDLEAGYPDDAELLSAIQQVRANLDATAPTAPATPPPAESPVDGTGMQFRPDQPY